MCISALQDLRILYNLSLQNLKLNFCTCSLLGVPVCRGDAELPEVESGAPGRKGLQRRADEQQQPAAGRDPAQTDRWQWGRDE